MLTDLELEIGGSKKDVPDARRFCLEAETRQSGPSCMDGTVQEPEVSALRD